MPSRRSIPGSRRTTPCQTPAVPLPFGPTDSRYAHNFAVTFTSRIWGTFARENRATIRVAAAALSTVNQDPTMDEGQIDEVLDGDDREHAGDTGDD